GDSAGVAGYSLGVRKDPKVFKCGEFLLGYTSSFRMGQILRYYLRPETPKEGQAAFEYMVCVFVPAVRKLLDEHGYLIDKNGREEIGTFLVGWRGSLFTVEDDLQVAELAAPYAACGCGHDLALGSLCTTEQLTGLTARDRLMMALEAAESFSAGVRGPFVVLKTEPKSFLQKATP
ncbi:hypothetical protein LCGC14_2768260, partial [marine sediment metagenome]